MRISIEWLKRLCNNQYDSMQIITQLTAIGLEVESLTDEVVDLAIPPNRADCLGVMGIARELAAVNNIIYQPLEVPVTEVTINDKVNVKVDNSRACPRYLARIIKDVNNKVQTPDYIKQALEEFGTKVISPIVDITNYVMLEYGQPLHAFNLKEINGEQIIVRDATTGESLLLLDDIKYELTLGTLVIADKEKPIALAGIMGGKDSGVWEDTTDIVLECAYFEPINIRKAAKYYKIKSEAGYRFERALDPYMQRQALERATQLIMEITGGQVGEIQEALDTNMLPEAVRVTLRLSRIDKILGVKIAPEKIKQILTNLGMGFDDKGEVLYVTIPTFRTDIGREEDLIEEIARIYGLDNIEPQASVATFNFNRLPETITSEAQILNCLINRGYHEAITYSFIDKELATHFIDDVNLSWELANPIASNMSLMRPSLLPGLLSAVQYNINRQRDRLKLFEIGLRFEGEEQNLQQIKTIAGICCGANLPENWNGDKRQVDYYDLKADISALFSMSHNLDAIEFIAAQDKTLHPGKSAKVIINGQTVGKLGSIHPEILQKVDINTNIVGFELDYSAVAAAKIPSFKTISKFPMVRRDLSILVDCKIQAAEIKSVIADNIGESLNSLVVFDVFQGKNIEPGKKSISIGACLQAKDRTLLDPEINEIFNKVTEELKTRFNAVLR